MREEVFQIDHLGARLLNACLLVLLVGCGGGDEFADIKVFMREVENKPQGSIQALPEFEPYQAFTYGASNRRSPFEPPVVVQAKTAEQKRNIGVKPPENHIKQHLERFNLASLSMVGTLQQEDNIWALIEDPNGDVYRVQVGQYMGTQWGRIESINDIKIDINEIVSDGADGYLHRPKTLELRSD